MPVSKRQVIKQLSECFESSSRRTDSDNRKQAITRLRWLFSVLPLVFDHGRNLRRRLCDAYAKRGVPRQSKTGLMQFSFRLKRYLRTENCLSQAFMTFHLERGFMLESW